MSKVIETEIGRALTVLRRHGAINDIDAERINYQANFNNKEKLRLINKIGIQAVFLFDSLVGMHTKIRMLIPDSNKGSKKDGCKSIW